MYVKHSSADWTERTPLENDAADFHLRRIAARIAREDRLLAVVEAAARKIKNIAGGFTQRCIFEPFNERRQLSISLQNVKRVVVPSVFADKPLPSCGQWRRSLPFGARQKLAADPNSVFLRRHAQTVRQPAIFDQ